MKQPMIRMLSTLCLFALITSAQARLSPDQLADRIEAAHAEQLSRIERVTFTSNIQGGIIDGITSVTRYEKVIKDGRAILQALDDDSEEAVSLAGMHDGLLPKMVRGASKVESGRYDGRPVYVVTVDDVDFLKSLEDFQMDDEFDEDFEPKKATFWLDRDNFAAHRLEFVQAVADGGEMTINVTMHDYRTLRGLPVAHRVKIDIRGVDQMISAADLAEARAEMQQLEEQLQHMPPEIRDQIKAQLGPQLAQLEAMMDSGGTSMEVHVTDVSFD